MLVNNVMGENTRILRKNAGFTQESLARYLSVDQNIISKFEKGEEDLSADMIERIALLFGITVEQMEEQNVTASKISFAFQGSDLTINEMEAIAAINKIAFNSELMHHILS